MTVAYSGLQTGKTGEAGQSPRALFPNIQSKLTPIEGRGATLLLFTGGVLCELGVEQEQVQNILTQDLNPRNMN